MESSLRNRADARLEDALERDALHDPRELYRGWLRRLKERDPVAFAEARRHYEEVLIPRVAAEEADAVAEWLDYGCRLGDLTGAGRLVAVDASGRARTAVAPLPRDRLVLYLPDDAREPAAVVNLPRQLSAAQQATYDLLVAGRTAV